MNLLCQRILNLRISSQNWGWKVAELLCAGHCCTASIKSKPKFLRAVIPRPLGITENLRFKFCVYKHEFDFDFKKFNMAETVSMKSCANLVISDPSSKCLRRLPTLWEWLFASISIWQIIRNTVSTYWALTHNTDGCSVVLQLRQSNEHSRLVRVTKLLRRGQQKIPAKRKTLKNTRPDLRRRKFIQNTRKKTRKSSDLW